MDIEKGCLAVIINSRIPENNGTCVTIGDYLGEVDGYWGQDRWEIDVPIKNTAGGDSFHQQESMLMRIDGLREKLKEKESEIA